MGQDPKKERVEAVVASTEVRNVFDEHSFIDQVPVTIVRDGVRQTVGEAKLYQNGEYVHAEMELKTDDADDVVKLFKDGISSIGDFSIPGEGVPETGRHKRSDTDIQVAAGLDVHNHVPVQHRDGKAPWCQTCGLDADYAKPVSRIPSAGQPQRPNLRREGQ